MRIALLLPSALSSLRYGAHIIYAPQELAVSLGNGFVARGHSVWLYSSSEVKTDAHIIPGDEELIKQDFSYFQFQEYTEPATTPKIREVIMRDYEYDLTMRAYKAALHGEYDIIHTLHNFGAHYFSELTQFPTVYTLNDPVPQSEHSIEYRRFLKFSHHNFVSISDSQRKGILPLNFVATVHNGINLREFPFNDSPQEHLIHFGRIMKEKGLDTAISVSKSINIHLKIASSLPVGKGPESFYIKKIQPEIDNKLIQFVGLVRGEGRSRFIGMGRAFLFPLRWEEPFGLAMIESMACGTPVIAYNKGSVSEIVRDGLTGFIIDPDNEERPGKGGWIIKKQGEEGLKEAVRRIDEIDRRDCRKHVEENFSAEKMVEGYEEVYKMILSKKT